MGWATGGGGGGRKAGPTPFSSSVRSGSGAEVGAAGSEWDGLAREAPVQGGEPAGAGVGDAAQRVGDGVAGGHLHGGIDGDVAGVGEVVDGVRGCVDHRLRRHRPDAVHLDEQVGVTLDRRAGAGAGEVRVGRPDIDDRGDAEELLLPREPSDGHRVGQEHAGRRPRGGEGRGAVRARAGDSGQAVLEPQRELTSIDRIAGAEGAIGVAPGAPGGLDRAHGVVEERSGGDVAELVVGVGQRPERAHHTRYEGQHEAGEPSLACHLGILLSKWLTSLRTVAVGR